MLLTTQYLEEADRLAHRIAVVDRGQVIAEGAVRLSTHDGAGMLLDVLRTLDAEGLVPTTVNVREPSLDDAFLAVTGRHAESPDTGSQLPERGAA